MILTEVGHYLRSRGRAALEEIALHCDSDPDAVRGMLEIWLRKGRVRRCLAVRGGCVGGCDRCGSGDTEMYEWVPDSLEVERARPSK